MHHWDALPLELLHQIFQDDAFIAQDWKILRLINRRWETHATKLLFRRIRLSKLESDRRSFFEISKTPHIADKVRELVWEELAQDGQSFKLFENPRRLQTHRPFHLEDYFYLGMYDQDLKDLYAHLFSQSESLFWIDVPESAVPDQPEILQALQGDFFAALDAMPGIDTFTSRPMDPLRLFCESPDCFPMTAQLFQRGMATIQLRNYGYSAFLLPGMRYRLSCHQPIRRLCFVDEGKRTSICRIDKHSFSAFEHLARLDLNLSDIECQPFFNGLTRMLRSCQSLQELRLCGERAPSKDGAQFDVGKCLSDPAIRLPLLQTLQLDHAQFSLYDLVNFVCVHAATLRVLRVTGLVPIKILWDLKSMNNLELSQLSISAPDETVSRMIVNEREALAFVNNSGHAPGMEPDDFEQSSFLETQIDTDPMMRNFFVADALDLTTRQVAHPSLAYQSSEVCDAEMENTRASSPTASIYQGNTYAAEECHDDQRWSEAPRWSWAWSRRLIGPQSIYCWMVSPEQSDTGAGEHPTELWKFTHRNGQVAIGQEPLEFWADWQGTPESGDRTEPTPYGRRLFEFVKASTRRTQEKQAPDVQIPWDRALEYDVTEDPMFNGYQL